MFVLEVDHNHRTSLRFSKCPGSLDQTRELSFSLANHEIPNSFLMSFCNMDGIELFIQPKCTEKQITETKKVEGKGGGGEMRLKQGKKKT